MNNSWTFCKICSRNLRLILNKYTASFVTLSEKKVPTIIDKTQEEAT